MDATPGRPTSLGRPGSRGVSWCDLDGTYRYGDRSNPFVGLSDHVPLIGTFRIKEQPAYPKLDPTWAEASPEGSSSAP